MRRRRGKRLLDLVGAGVALAGFAPVMGLASVLIVLEDGRPVRFRQERVGRGGTPFRITKLRTMRDGRVTRTGRWLRATGLDEVPQFVDVLRGRMSIVGPRPLTREDLDRLGWSGDVVRQSIAPGITGPAQIFGTDPERSRALDHRYAAEASLGVDVELIAWSAVINVVGKNRVRRWLRGHRWAD